MGWKGNGNLTRRGSHLVEAKKAKAFIFQLLEVMIKKEKRLAL